MDVNGYYAEGNISLPENEKYKEPVRARRVYISKLGLMDAVQQTHYNDIISYIQTNYEVIPVTIERSDYRRDGQIVTIKEKMSECSGVLVIDFAYLTVEKGVIHKNIDSNKNFLKRVINKYVNSGNATRLTGQETNFSSPWLQIEAAFAISNNMPCMVVREKDVYANGVFDPVVLNSDKKRLFSFEYQESLDDQKPLFDAWIEQVDKFSV